jgi:predicted enzyme related to lactoylglutathione lyase
MREEKKMSEGKLIPGKFVWFELVSEDTQQSKAFYAEVLGWKVEPFPMGQHSYDMIYANDRMIGSFAIPRGNRQPAHWISYVSVEDVDSTANAAAQGRENGAAEAHHSPDLLPAQGVRVVLHVIQRTD